MHVNHYNFSTFGEVGREWAVFKSFGFTTNVVSEPFQCLLAVLALPLPSGLRTGPESLVPDVEATIKQPPTSGSSAPLWHTTGSSIQMLLGTGSMPPHNNAASH